MDATSKLSLSVNPQLCEISRLLVISGQSSRNFFKIPLELPCYVELNFALWLGIMWRKKTPVISFTLDI